MEVEDDGRGGDAPFGNGLTGMRERIQALGGVASTRNRPRHAPPDQAAAVSDADVLAIESRTSQARKELTALSRIRVLIAEDQGMVLGALAALLEIEPDIEVVARAHDGREALALAPRTDPDVVLTDIEMPNMTGLEMAAELTDTRQGRPPARDHPHDVRAARLPAPRARCRRVRISAEGRARRKAGRRDSRRAPGPARRRSATGAGRVGRSRSADRSRAAGAARRRRRRWRAPTSPNA